MRLPITIFWAMAFLTCGAGCQAPRDREKVIAVVSKGTCALFWQSIHTGVVVACRDLRVQIAWSGPPVEADYSRQIQIVDSMNARRVDGLALSACDHTALNGAIERAARAGIPVTVFDSGVDTNEYLTYLATNNPEAGGMAARKLA